MSKTPEELHKEAQDKIDAERAKVASSIPAPPSISAADITNALAATGLSKDAVADALEEVIGNILNKRKAKKLEEFRPKEPNYSVLTEADAFNQDVYIPVIEHDLPDYMNVRLKDDEYVPIWVNKDQRQLGAKFAEGFELLKKEHLATDFTAPLRFNSEGMYEYQDVVCLRVHKRIRFAKLRRYFEISKNQLKPAQAQENAKSTLMEKVILGDPALDQAFASGAYKFYHTDT